jgi:dihydrofolate synthase / folylpolyglutamate synthase
MSVIDHPLHRLPKFGDGIGLHRVAFLMEALGIDTAEVSRRAIAVTGSNGKGSTARIAAELLRATGNDVGLFTSPHLYRYNERFRVNGTPVEDAALLAAMDKVLQAVGSYQAHHTDAVGAFEAQFVVALSLFLARNCRWLVLEAGIGGRYDPVRLAHAPVATLVSLDLEHTDLLGETLLEIALDKLDAVALGGFVVLGESCRPFEKQIRVFAGTSNVTTEFVDPGDLTDRGVRDGWQHFDIGCFKDLRSRLVGRHQINNHAVAIAAVRERLKRSGLAVDLEDTWRNSIAGVNWPGRLETISRDPLVIIDVGHTPEGIKTALAGFRVLTSEREAILVTGGSQNKHVREMLEVLAPSFDRIVCTCAYHNGLPAPEVEALAKAINPAAEIVLCPKIEDAIEAARSGATRLGRAVYVAGGLFLAAEFAESWRGGDASVLRFF